MEKTLLITGASKGIGAEIALQAARQGYRICLNYHRDIDAAESVATAVRGAGAEVFVCRADVSNEQEVGEMFRLIDRQFGGLTALVNNAGIVALHSDLVDMSLERMRKVFEINVLGSMLCAREAVKRMTVLGGGGIVNISSGAAKHGSAHEYVDYAASKGAIDTFTIGLAKEVADKGIRVNAIRPGLIETTIHQQTGVPDRLQRKKHLVPMGRAGQPAEIASAVLWLLSAEASYTTGAILDVTGGL